MAVGRDRHRWRTPPVLTCTLSTQETNGLPRSQGLMGPKKPLSTCNTPHTYISINHGEASSKPCQLTQQPSGLFRLPCNHRWSIRPQGNPSMPFNARSFYWGAPWPRPWTPLSGCLISPKSAPHRVFIITSCWALLCLTGSDSYNGSQAER